MNFDRPSFFQLLGLSLLFLVALSLPKKLYAQRASKLNTELFRLLQNTPSEQQATILRPVLIKGQIAEIPRLVKREGGTYKYGAVTIASAELSLQGIARLLEEEAVERIEFRSAKAQFLGHVEDSLMLQHNRVNAVYQGAAPFPKAFRGQGVLLGIIDDGFEWQHPDFWQADSSTRILHLWDQNSGDARFFEYQYGYGAAWTKVDIDNYQCSHRALDHGSHVMGTAGGNARATGKYRGIAPETDLAAVAITSGTYFLSGFVDGLHYLLAEAAALGQPCVVNSSVGSYASGHDGKDLYAQLVAQLLQARSGQVLVQAGGNARQFPLHLGVSLQNDTAITAFQYHQATQKTHFTCYADTADWSAITFVLELIHPQTGQRLAQTRSFNVGRNFTLTGGIAQWSEWLFADAQGRDVTLNIYVDQYEDAYATTVEIASASDLGLWQLRCSGTGKYDIWSDEQHLGSSNMLTRTTPHYHSPDNAQTIVGFCDLCGSCGRR